MKETRCSLCGKGKLREDVSEFRSYFVDDAGVRRDVVVPNVLKLRCDTCGEYLIDPDSESRISAAQREALGLLGAVDLQQFRRKLNLSQEAMAELLGLGKKTWCRWESTDHFQSKAFDRYLRLLIEVPANVEMLKLLNERRRVSETPSEAAPKDVFLYVKRWDVIQETEKQFTAMLAAGTAFTAN